MQPTPITKELKTKKIENQTFDEERALYNIKDTEVINCTFAGEADGESVLKEGRNYKVKNCSFSFHCATLCGTPKNSAL